MKVHDSSVHCQRSGWQPVPAGHYNGYTLGVSQGISHQMPISSGPAQHARPSAAKLQHTCLPERPANNLHNPQHPRPQAGRTSRSSHAKSLRRKPKGQPEKAWTEAGSERKDSWGRFDLKIDEIEEGKIVFLVPNGDWTTAHPALVLGCDDKENVHVLQCTSFGKSTSIHSRFGNLEQPERDLNKSDYLLIADRPFSKGPKPHLGLPVLRLRDKWPLAKATYVWFEFPRSFKLSQLRHYADGLSIDHTFVLNGASKRIVRAQLERRLQRMYHNLSVKREELAGKGKPLEQTRAAEDKMAEIERTHLTKVLRRCAEQVAKIAKEGWVNRMSGVESGKIQSRGATKTRARKLMRPKKQSRKPSDQI
ncbi:hypothetical protein MPH_01134 [Macrophomina phaseolina MS6]|uniref:Uncharacterized protein n=1 Tax=Macrophomina phaseolina (strain MS6) TaxID=1126212 RepID=K2SYC2_MACPH|nr:hypothetical protein MPH_01134 [Macrophomina phaseolina MS6]